MKISIGSGCYAGGCLVLGTLNAYENPVQWITTFVLGVLAGLWLGNMMASAVLTRQNVIAAAQSSKRQKASEGAQEAVNAGAQPTRTIGKLLSGGAQTVKELKTSLQQDFALGALVYTAIPGKVVTVLNLLAGAVNWVPGIDACAAFCKRIPANLEKLGLMTNLISSFALGYQVGASIQLGRLWFNLNPGLHQKLKAVVL